MQALHAQAEDSKAQSDDEALRNKGGEAVSMCDCFGLCVCVCCATSRAHPLDRQQACVCIVSLSNINETHTHMHTHTTESHTRQGLRGQRVSQSSNHCDDTV